MILLTRREIIEQWQKQDDSILDSFCCPNCREVLISNYDGSGLLCDNPACPFTCIEKSEIERIK